MASYHSLGEELECPICLEYPMDPKVMGRCLHAACLDCLKKLVAAQYSTSFPCPVCREVCRFPPNGVTGLKDDFRQRALVEKVQKIRSNKSLIQCIACPNPAFHLCKKCDKIYLCRDCSRKHSRNPLTTAHELVGICSKHGKKLDMFCRECKAAICCACLIADHHTESHNVVPHQEVVEKEAAAVVKAVERLDKAREQKEAALGNIIDIRDSVVATINSDLVRLGRQSDSAIEHVHNKHSKLKAESNGIEEQIETLMKRKNTVDKEIIQTEQTEASLHQQKEEFSNYLNHYREVRMNEFLVAVTQAAEETEEIKAKLDLGHEATSSKPLLDGLTVPKLVKVKEELTKAIAAAEQGDRVALFVDAKENLARFVPSSTSVEIGHFIGREFTIMEKFADISIPSDCPLEGLYCVRLLAGGRLASMYRSKNSNPADTILLHDLAFQTVPQKIISKDIYPAVDMTVTSTGELMVLRKTKPAVRVFNTHSGGFRDMNIDIHSDAIDNVLSIETNEEGIIFVLINDVEDDDTDDEVDEDDLFSDLREQFLRELHEQLPTSMLKVRIEGVEAVKEYKDGHVCFFNPVGALIKKVNVSLSFPSIISYSGFTRTIYIANDQNILRYYWDCPTHKEMPPLAHGVDGFKCTDVSTGNDGQVFAVGMMTPTDEVAVFQVVETKQLVKQKELATAVFCRNKGDDTTEVKMIKLTFDDNVGRNIAHGWLPCIMCISVFGNTLALGLKDKVELFHLKQSNRQ